MQEDWRSHVTAVGGMFEEVFSAGISSGAEQRDSAFHQEICLRKFALMLRRDVWQSGDVFAVADRRRPTIGYVCLEEPCDGEG
eukprot:5789847-Pleurochrysis_carterae.AAC.1